MMPMRLVGINFMRTFKMYQINKTAGFSLVELMVVVAIISGLIYLGMPRFRQFQATSRRAEAISTLGTIHKLQTLHQQDKERFAEWPATKIVGNNGTTTRKCTWGTDGEDTGVKGAKSLGFRPTGCEEMRYGYFILRNETGGKENFLAVAYAQSNADTRIYPACDGNTSSRAAKPSVFHKDQVAITFAAATKKGDLLAIDEEQRLNTYLETGGGSTPHTNNDIVLACQG